MKKTVFLGVAAVVLVGAIIWVWSPRPTAIPENITVPQTHAAYFMQREFYTGIENPDTVVPTEENVYGGIVSHHFFAERSIANFFGQLSNQHPSVVVVIGPNHFNAGSGEVIISREGYQTPWGILESDSKQVEELLKSGPAVNEEGPFDHEHSISTLVGFIKHTFPDTKIVPIILRRGSRLATVDKLVEQLSNTLLEDALVLASVDFSHHVDNQTAQRQDSQTLPMLKNFDYSGILKRTPAEMDSPPTIYTLLKYLEKRGTKSSEHINTNQAILSGNLDSKDVTSYFFSYYKK